jgi:hypothetical protein
MIWFLFLRRAKGEWQMANGKWQMANEFRL